MHIDPHVLIAVGSTLAAAWLMITAGLEKSALERRRQKRVCPSCGREIQARVCTACAG
jgi:formate dehydrogenase maturation protein FdhE